MSPINNLFVTLLVYQSLARSEGQFGEMLSALHCPAVMILQVRSAACKAL